MAGEPQKPAPPAPPSTPATPFWRSVPLLAGVADAMDAVTAAVAQAQTWVQGQLPAAVPARHAALTEQLGARQAGIDQRTQANAAGVSRFFGSTPVQQAAQSLTARYATPPADVTKLGARLRDAVTERGDTRRAELADAGLSALDPMFAATEEWLPNFAIDTAVDSMSPVGMAMNVDLPVAPAAKAGATLLGALPPGFYSRVDRVIAEQVGKKGVTPERLRNLLKAGAHPEEITLRKLDAMLAAAPPNQPIPKETLTAHLAAHPPPQVTTQTLGGRPPAPATTYDDYVQELIGRYGEGFDSDELEVAEQNMLARLWNERQANPRGPAAPGRDRQPRHASENLRLPGGEHYGETLYQVPPQMALQGESQVTILSPTGERVWGGVNVSEREVAALRAQYEPGGYTLAVTPTPTPVAAQVYTAGHYGEFPNVIANARHTERFFPAPTRSLAEIEALIVQALNAPRASGHTFRPATAASLASGSPEVAVRAGLITPAEAAAYGKSKGYTNYPELHGERYAHLDEFQADVHQQARKRGYRQPPTAEQQAEIAALTEEQAAREAAVTEARTAHEAQNNAYLDHVVERAHANLPPEFAHLTGLSQAMRAGPDALEAWRRARQAALSEPGVQALVDAQQAAERAMYARIQAATDIRDRIHRLQGDPNALPDLPFKDDAWMDLVLRDRLYNAAQDPNIAGFSWSSGQTIADRYDLAKYVDQVHFEPDTPGDYSVGTLVGIKDGEEILRHGGVEPRQFSAYLPKDQADLLTKKLQAHGEQAAHERAQWSVDWDPEERAYLAYDSNGEVLHDFGGDVVRFDSITEANGHIDDLLRDSAEQMQRSAARDGDPHLPALTGEELRFGKQWPFEMYDTKTPRKVRSAIEPLGGKVEPSAIPVEKEVFENAPGFSVRDNFGHMRGWWATREEAEAYLRNPPPQMESYVSAAGGARIMPAEGGRNVTRTIDEPSWRVRFTPDLREKIKKGFPLMSVLPPAALAGAGAASQLSDDESTRQAGAGLGMAAAMLPFGGKGVRNLGALSRAERAAAEAFARPAGIRAYHGSPHDFDKFDLSKLGTGEGAQAFGHGLYFAEDEGVARGYRDRLSGRGGIIPGASQGRGQWQAHGVPVPEGIAGHKALDTAQDIQGLLYYQKHGYADMAAVSRGNIERRIANWKATNPQTGIADTDMRALADYYETYLRDARPEHITQRPEGKMYEVNLNVDPTHLLDWDRAAGEQTPHVQAAVARALGRQPEWRPGTTGQEIYRAVDGGRRAAGVSEAPTAEAFLRQGVPGIRYLDGSSRPKAPDLSAIQSQLDSLRGRLAKTPNDLGLQTDLGYWEQELQNAQGFKGTSNYTMFSDEPIDILRKYGLLGPLAGGAAAAQFGAPDSAAPPTSTGPAPSFLPPDRNRPY